MTAPRYVLVTGSSTGIGQATALHLDRLGWRVFAGVRRDHDGERLRARWSERLTPVRLDVTDEEQVAGAFAVIEDIVGDHGLAGLVNNAGIARGGPSELLPLDQWREQFEVNLIGQVAVTKAALPALRRATGRIVFVSSVSGRWAPAFLGPYAASKHALEAFAESLREEMLPWGIQVAVMEPGQIGTPIWSKARSEEELVLRADDDALEPYRSQLETVATRLESRPRGSATPPMKVAEAVEHALTVPRPRYRYLVGRDAQVMGTFERILPDRVFTRMRRRF